MANNKHDYSELKQKIKNEISEAVKESTLNGIQNGILDAMGSNRTIKFEGKSVKFDTSELKEKIKTEIQNILSGVSKNLKIDGVDLTSFVTLDKNALTNKINELYSSAFDEEGKIRKKYTSQLVGAVEIAKNLFGNEFSFSKTDLGSESSYEFLLKESSLSQKAINAFSKDIQETLKNSTDQIELTIHNMISELDFSKILSEQLKKSVDASLKEFDAYVSTIKVSDDLKNKFIERIQFQGMSGKDAISGLKAAMESSLGSIDMNAKPINTNQVVKPKRMINFDAQVSAQKSVTNVIKANTEAQKEEAAATKDVADATKQKIDIKKQETEIEESVNKLSNSIVDSEKMKQEEISKTSKYTEEQLQFAEKLGLRLTEKGTNIHKSDRDKFADAWNKKDIDNVTASIEKQVEAQKDLNSEKSNINVASNVISEQSNINSKIEETIHDKQVEMSVSQENANAVVKAEEKKQDALDNTKKKLSKNIQMADSSSAKAYNSERVDTTIKSQNELTNAVNNTANAIQNENLAEQDFQDKLTLIRDLTSDYSLIDIIQEQDVEQAEELNKALSSITNADLKALGYNNSEIEKYLGAINEVSHYLDEVIEKKYQFETDSYGDESGAGSDSLLSLRDDIEASAGDWENVDQKINDSIIQVDRFISKVHDINDEQIKPVVDEKQTQAATNAINSLEREKSAIASVSEEEKKELSVVDEISNAEKQSTQIVVEEVDKKKTKYHELIDEYNKLHELHKKVNSDALLSNNKIRNLYDQKYSKYLKMSPQELEDKYIEKLSDNKSYGNLTGSKQEDNLYKRWTGILALIDVIKEKTGELKDVKIFDPSNAEDIEKGISQVDKYYNHLERWIHEEQSAQKEANNTSAAVNKAKEEKKREMSEYIRNSTSELEKAESELFEFIKDGSTKLQGLSNPLFEAFYKVYKLNKDAKIEDYTNEEKYINNVNKLLTNEIQNEQELRNNIRLRTQENQQAQKAVEEESKRIYSSAQEISNRLKELFGDTFSSSIIDRFVEKIKDGTLKMETIVEGMSYKSFQDKIAKYSANTEMSDDSLFTRMFDYFKRLQGQSNQAKQAVVKDQQQIYSSFSSFASNEQIDSLIEKLTQLSSILEEIGNKLLALGNQEKTLNSFISIKDAVDKLSQSLGKTKEEAFKLATESFPTVNGRFKITPEALNGVIANNLSSSVNLNIGSNLDSQLNENYNKIKKFVNDVNLLSFKDFGINIDDIKNKLSELFDVIKGIKQNSNITIKSNTPNDISSQSASQAPIRESVKVKSDTTKTASELKARTDAINARTEELSEAIVKAGGVINSITDFEDAQGNLVKSVMKTEQFVNGALKKATHTTDYNFDSKAVNTSNANNLDFKAGNRQIEKQSKENEKALKEQYDYLVKQDEEYYAKRAEFQKQDADRRKAELAQYNKDWDSAISENRKFDTNKNSENEKILKEQYNYLVKQDEEYYARRKQYQDEEVARMTKESENRKQQLKDQYDYVNERESEYLRLRNKYKEEGRIQQQQIAYEELSQSVSRYITVSKRIASGKPLEGDIEEADTLDGKIKKLTKDLSDSPLFSKSLEKKALSGLNGLDKILDDLRKKAALKNSNNEFKRIDVVIQSYDKLISSEFKYQELIQKSKSNQLSQSETKTLAKLTAEREYANRIIQQETVLTEKQMHKYQEYQRILAQTPEYLRVVQEQQKIARVSGLSDISVSLGEKYFEKNNVSNKTQDYINNLAIVKEKIDAINADISKIQSKPLDMVTDKELEDISLAEKEINNLFKKVTNNPVNEAKVTSIITQTTSWMFKNTKISAEARSQLEKYIEDLRNASDASTIPEIVSQINNVKAAEIAAGRTGKTFFDLLKKTASSMARYLTMYTSFYRVIGTIKSAIATIQGLDTALVDLKKTTEMSNAQLEKFYYDSNDIAKRMGVTTQSIIEQAAAWSRLGYSSQEAVSTMAELSSKFASISPGMDTNTAQEGLVSMMKAFNVAPEDVERTIMDNVNKIGNTLAVTNENIVDMMERSSAAMAAANNTLEETIALEAAAFEITQNAESTGTAFKTISMRIRGYDEETEELSEDLKEISGDIADLTKINGKGGISIFEEGSNGETYKSTYQILKEISEIWDELTDKQQADLLEKLGGKRGGQVIAGMLADFSSVEKAMTNMENAAGSADAEMGIITDSVDYKLNMLKETWTGLTQTLISSDFLKNAVDALIKLSEAISKLVESGNALPALAGTLGAFLGFKGNGRGKSNPHDMPLDICLSMCA